MSADEQPGGTWRDIGEADSLGFGELRQVDVDGALVVLVAGEGGVAAFQGVCSHEGHPMVEGYLDGDQLICALHGSTFDIRTGAVELGPAEEPLARYETRVVNGRLQLFVPDSGLTVNE